MPDYGNRPRRRAAIEATARLHEQVAGGRAVAPRRRVGPSPVEPQTRRGHLAVGPIMPSPQPPASPAVPDVHRVALPPGAEVQNRPVTEDEHALPPVPNTVRPRKRKPRVKIRV